MVGYFSPGYSLLTASSATISRMKKKTMKSVFFFEPPSYLFLRDFVFLLSWKSAAANGLCFFSLNLLFFPLETFLFCCCQVTGVCKRFSLDCVCVYSKCLMMGPRPFWLFLPASVNTICNDLLPSSFNWEKKEQKISRKHVGHVGI